MTGSILEIIYPDFATWETQAGGYVYPFIFSSDSTWEVNVCAEVPQGYRIVGVYDTAGTLIANAPCTQTIVAEQTLVAAFAVQEIGSPEPHLKAKLKVRGPNGRLQELDLEVPGRRNYRPAERPAGPPAPPPGGSRRAAALIPGALLVFAGIGSKGYGWAGKRRNRDEA